MSAHGFLRWLSFQSASICPRKNRGITDYAFSLILTHDPLDCYRFGWLTNSVVIRRFSPFSIPQHLWVRQMQGLTVQLLSLKWRLALTHARFASAGQHPITLAFPQNPTGENSAWSPTSIHGKLSMKYSWVANWACKPTRQPPALIPTSLSSSIGETEILSCASQRMVRSPWTWMAYIPGPKSVLIQLWHRIRS